jgi:hypothetical protein
MLYVFGKPDYSHQRGATTKNQKSLVFSRCFGAVYRCFGYYGGQAVPILIKNPRPYQKDGGRYALK